MAKILLDVKSQVIHPFIVLLLPTGAPLTIAVLVFRFEYLFSNAVVGLKDAGRMANIINSDHGLHCLLRSFYVLILILFCGNINIPAGLQIMPRLMVLTKADLV